jgi:hypothetical protein
LGSRGGRALRVAVEDGEDGGGVGALPEVVGLVGVEDGEVVVDDDERWECGVVSAVAGGAERDPVEVGDPELLGGVEVWVGEPEDLDVESVCEVAGFVLGLR